MAGSSLYTKMAEIMGEIGNIPKEGTNTHFNYKFVTADAIADRIRKALSDRKIAFFAAITHRELVQFSQKYIDGNTGAVKSEKSINRWVVDFEFTFADGDSGEVEKRPWTAEADANDDKGINKCATAAEKYFLLKTFVVSTGDEPDSDGDQPRKAKQQKAPQAPNSTPSPASSASPSANGGSGKWERKSLYEATKDYFTNEFSFNNWLKSREAELPDTLDAAVKHIAESRWNKSKKGADAFVEQVANAFDMNAAQVLEALAFDAEDKLKSVRDYDGLKSHAWGACLAWNAAYDAKMIQNLTTEKTGEVIIRHAETLCQRWQAAHVESAS